MENANFNQLVSFVFGIANDCLVDVYDVGDYRKIILPMIVLRRFDAVLEPTKQAVLAMKQKLDAAGIMEQDVALCSVAHEAFCNSSPFTLSDLKSRTFSKNVEKVSKKYPLNPSGYFGEKGKNHRVIVSDNPIETSVDFYKTISCGGKESQLSNGKGVQTVFEDGTRIVYRVITSTPDSPAVDITVNIESPVKKQKIHFIRKD